MALRVGPSDVLRRGVVKLDLRIVRGDGKVGHEFGKSVLQRKHGYDLGERDPVSLLEELLYMSAQLGSVDRHLVKQRVCRDIFISILKNHPCQLCCKRRGKERSLER